MRRRALLVLAWSAITAAILPTVRMPASRPTSPLCRGLACMSGFGGPVKSKAPKKKKGKANKRGTPPPQRGTPAAPTARVQASAMTAEEVREAHMASIRRAVDRHAGSIADHLEEHGYAVVDEFLSSDAVATMRSEAAALLAGGHMMPSQSTRYDEESGTVVAYEKNNVLSTNLRGGEAYHLSPRMHEYCVALVSSLAPRLNVRLSGVDLSDTLHANKLAVCLGDGSRYDKHYDNMGDGDLRKLTALLYLQRSWTDANGGCFRMYTRGEGLEPDGDGELPHVDLPPLGGRLLVFWADEMVHAVNPSQASGGEDEHRWALTVWFQATDPQGISFDAEMEQRHFADAGTSGLGVSG